MANTDIGKQFEARFATDYKRCFPDSFLFRLHDQMTGYKETSQNPCDFIAYPGSCLLMVECKAHKGMSIPFNAIPQYERLLSYKGFPKVFPGVVIWFYEKDIVIWVSIDEMEKSGHKFKKKGLYVVIIKYIAPVLLLAVFLKSIGII